MINLFKLWSFVFNSARESLADDILGRECDPADVYEVCN